MNYQTLIPDLKHADSDTYRTYMWIPNDTKKS